MSTATTIQRFLQQHHVECDAMHHPHTATAWESAMATNVEPDCMAKAVMLGDDKGLMMAVVPASHDVKLRQLRRETGRKLRILREREFARLFPDCEVGAIPPIGPAYGMEMVWDDCLAEQSDIYFEAGDHENLMHVSSHDFVDMLRGSRHGCISSQR
ncbi:MAG: YbaK/EbsC family protein [Rhodocyclaceae bacterium]|nr:YbaK/EbsC family protein [Rhodocyclaceae bacterium]